ncbi:hypothetical protein CerSpe_048780 [Prunus speciosa]
MALVCRVLSAARRSLQPKALAISSSSQRWLSNQTSLLQRLVEEPNSRIKSILGSEEFSALQSSDFSWETLLTSLASSSSPDKSRLVLEWKLENLLGENEKDRDRYSELISLCGKIQNLPLAMQVFTSMEANGIKPTSAIFNSLVHACFSSGKADSMQAWYSAKKAAGFSSDVQTYQTLISSCIKSNNFELADWFYDEMVLSGLMPNLPISENMLEGLCKRNSFDQVKEFMKIVLDAGWKINEKMAEMVVGLYIELGMVEKLEELLVDLMETNQVSEVLLLVHCGIIRLNAMLDRLDDVEYSVGRMLKQGVSFKHHDVVEKVICSYFRCSALDRLELFLERLKGSYELTKSTYDLLIAGYRRAGLSDRLNDMKCVS